MKDKDATVDTLTQGQKGKQEWSKPWKAAAFKGWGGGRRLRVEDE